jgi:ABC-type antimicrobial peptide transport system permease subunit
MVALVNQAFVNEFLPGRNPLGISVRFHREPQPPRPSGLPLDILGILEPEPDVPLKPSFSIVGVIQNELQRSDLGAPFEPMIYLDYQQIPKDSTLLGIMLPVSPFVIRSSLPPVVLDQELRTVLKQVASDMAEMQLATMEDKIAQALGERNLALRLVSSFGAMALLLAAVGIYGMLAYAVTLRRREIGIRMTLGSSRSGVTGLILAQAGWLIFAGVVPGLAAALVAGHAVRSFLFGVQPLDPASLAAAVALLLLAGMVAAVFPAWRAARVDPMEVLRTE